MCWYILLATFCQQKHCLIKDSVIPEDHFAEYLIKNRNGLTRQLIKKGNGGLSKAMYLPKNDRINFEDFIAQQSRFLVDPLDSQKQRPDASHRKSEFDTYPDNPADVNHKELLFATCPNDPADANHREHLFVRMSRRKSEDSG
jgi:hypothetical protein